MDMERQPKFLKDYSDLEKGAYIGAISSIATADKEAGEEEMVYLMALSDAAGLTEEQKELVLRAAKELSGEELNRCLDILRGSELKFSLVADLISFAESDRNLTPEEKENIERIADQLEINQQQFNLLDHFVKRTNSLQPPPEKISSPGFLSALGLDQKFKGAGMNLKSLTKGLLGFAGPMILASMVRRRLGRQATRNFNIPIGGNSFGSIISMLNGGQGFSGVGKFLRRFIRQES